MREKAEYRSSIRSKKLIRDAYLKLLEEKQDSRVTVTDIVKLADVNRGTFYSHYKDVDDLVKSIENDTMESLMEILDEMRDEKVFVDPLPFLLNVSDYFEKEKDYFKVLFRIGKPAEFFVKLQVKVVCYLLNVYNITDENDPDGDFVARVHFFVGGVSTIYMSYFSGHLNLTLEQIAYKIYEQFSSGNFKFNIEHGNNV